MAGPLSSIVLNCASLALGISRFSKEVFNHILAKKKFFEGMINSACSVIHATKNLLFNLK